MSSWLSSLCECPATTMVAPGQVQAVAAVIWKAKDTESESIITRKFSETLFRSVAVLINQTVSKLYQIFQSYPEALVRYIAVFSVVTQRVLCFVFCIRKRKAYYSTR